MSRDKDAWWATLLPGLPGVVPGGYALWLPAISMIAIAHLTAGWAVLVGLNRVFFAFQVRRIGKRADALAEGFG